MYKALGLAGATGFAVYDFSIKGGTFGIINGVLMVGFAAFWTVQIARPV